MTKLTPASWVKIVLIALLCLVLCAGVSGCMAGISYSVRSALGLFDSHYRMAEISDLQNVGTAEVAAETVRDIDIAWLAGSVEVVVVDPEVTGGMVVVEEFVRNDSANIPERDKMRWSLEGEQLSVVYAGEAYLGFGSFGLSGCGPSGGKRLVVSIPQPCAQNLRSVDISAASGHYSVQDIACECLSIDLASGSLATTGIRADELDLNMASGSARLEGVFPNIVNIDKASGETVLTCQEQCPTALTLSAMSGNSEIYVPEGSGYTVSCDKVSGSINCPGTSLQGDVYVAGDGSAAFVVDMTSGNVLIAQGAGAGSIEPSEPSALSAPTAPKAPTAPEAPTAPAAPTGRSAS